MSRLDSVLKRQQINALLDDVVDALIVTDSNGKVLYSNSSAEDLFGFGQIEPSDFERLNLLIYTRKSFDFSWLSGETVSEADLPLSRALRGESYKDVELWVRQKESDEKRIFSFSGTRLEGDPPLGILTIRDVTKERMAERRYRVSFETNPAPTLIARLTDGAVIDVNDGFTEMSGLPKEEARDRFLTDLGLLLVQDDLRQIIDSLKEGRFIERQQATIEHCGQKERTVLLAARPIDIESEECGIFTFLDITDLLDARGIAARLTAELADANVELDAFSFSASHDLRTHLRSVYSFSQLLQEGYGAELDETGQSYLERVLVGAHRLNGLLDALVLMSRVNRERLHMGRVNLSRIAEEAASTLQAQGPGRQAEFRIANGLEVQGDQRLLRTAIENLMNNAWKFTNGTGTARIEVGSERQGDETVYFVKDNGVGFEMRYADKLFVPFQRLHRREEFEGNGVGLAAVLRIVHRHGGTIWGEGRVGKGAAFYFTLPNGP